MIYFRYVNNYFATRDISNRSAAYVVCSEITAALSDATRLRIISLLEKDELSVHELQEITRIGQSRISSISDCCRIRDLCNRGVKASARSTS